MGARQGRGMKDVHGRREGARHPKAAPWSSGRAALLAILAWLRRRLHGFYAVAGVLLTGGLVLSLLGLWALSGLTESVMEGETLRFDEGVLRWMNARATPLLDRVALEVTALGEGLVVAAISVVAGTLLWLLGQRAYAALLAAAVGGAWLIYPVLKLVFDRPRPQLFEWRAQALAPSYPSGHATMSMVLLVVLAYIVHQLSGRRRVGVAAMLLAGAAVLLIGLSRLYLGVHYPSDVIAGYVVGFAWAVFCALAVEALRFQRHSRPSHPDGPERPDHAHLAGDRGGGYTVSATRGAASTAGDADATPPDSECSNP
jgi:membrane-associated phospholipid phosphatase